MTRWIGVLWGIVLLAVVVVAIAADRSGQWPAVRNAYHAAHPTCEACGSPDAVEVHHIRPVRLWPELELDPHHDNLITLCRRHHLELGHLGDTRANNPLVRQDAARNLATVVRYAAMVKARPYTREDVAKFEKQFSTAP